MSVKANKSLDDGLVLHLPMNEGSGSTVYDRSKNGNNGAITGAMWTEDVEKGVCFELDGTVKYGEFSEITLTGEFSLTCWVKRTSISKYMFIFGGSETATKIGFDYKQYNTYIRLNNTFCTSVAVPFDEWFFFCLRRNASNEVFLNVNNDASVKISSTATGNIVFKRIGVDEGGNYGVGFLKDARVYNRYISDDEVSALYRLGENKSLSDGLVLDMPLNEGSGTTVYDKSKYSNNGAISGASWVVDADLGNCLEFSNDKIVSVPYNADLDLLDNFTFSATIKRYEAKTVEAIFGAHYYGPIEKTGWNLEVFDGINNANLNLLIGTGTASIGYRDTTLLGLNEAIDVAVTYESGTIKFYVNGVLSSTITGAASPVSSSTAFKFGQRAIGDWDFYGIIKNARLYNRVLSATEISALYRLTKKGVE